MRVFAFLDVMMFLDGPDAKPSESIHLLFAGEKVRAEHPLPSPHLSTIDDPGGFRVIALEALVHMKLLSNCDQDRTHVRDLVGVGLIEGRRPQIRGFRAGGSLAVASSTPATLVLSLQSPQIDDYAPCRTRQKLACTPLRGSASPVNSLTEDTHRNASSQLTFGWT
jgi:hypothetical protein